MTLEPLLCMYCCEPADGRFEVDRDGELWVYCTACDVWTCHPPERIGATRDELRTSKW